MRSSDLSLVGRERRRVAHFRPAHGDEVFLEKQAAGVDAPEVGVGNIV